jgi:hypothetical protein
MNDKPAKPTIERAKRRLSQLKELLTEEGKTTVIKPDAL